MLNIDADRKGADADDAVAKRDRLPRTIDVCLRHEFLHAIEKVRGVAVDLEFDQIVPEHPAEDRFVDPDRQEAKDIGRRKGNVPELMNEQRRLHRAQEFGRQREVVVLNPGHRAAGAPFRLVGDGVREAQIHRPVSLPVLGAKFEMLNEHMTQRPQRAIREAVVVAVDVSLVEPDTAQRVTLLVGRHRDASQLVGDVAIGGA